VGAVLALQVQLAQMQLQILVGEAERLMLKAITLVMAVQAQSFFATPAQFNISLVAQ
jgi:hypothetical protein